LRDGHKSDGPADWGKMLNPNAGEGASYNKGLL
jgi:hypothetical protein